MLMSSSTSDGMPMKPRSQVAKSSHANPLFISLLPCSSHYVHAQMVWFYSFLFVVPTGLAFMLTGGRTQLSREELLASEAAHFCRENANTREEMKCQYARYLVYITMVWKGVRRIANQLGWRVVP